jgi:hypothetical protein
MKALDALQDFDELYRNHTELQRLADELKTPNPEDSVFVRAAIVGFSFHVPTEEWERQHLDFVLHKRQTEFSDYELTKLEAAGQRAGRFACLCLGYLLGLHQAKKISNEQFQVAEMQLPGFLMLKLPEFALLDGK